MTEHALEGLRSGVARLRAMRPVGRISAVQGMALRVSGLSAAARLGDRVRIRMHGGGCLTGEVVQMEPGSILVLPEQPVDGVALGDRVLLQDAAVVAPSRNWIGRIIDPFGVPLDGAPLLGGGVACPLRADPPSPARRRALGPRLETGMAAFNTLLPIARGQRLGIFAGSGVGKTMLLGHLARNMQADVVVIALIGERGRELRGFVDQVLGPEGLARAVIVAATSDRAALVRRRCAWTAMAVAEFFRDQGLHVLLVADSITRFAEAHREVATVAGEMPVLRGYPASTAHMIMALSERAGPGAGDAGDITALFTVLVAGSDMEEPVADILRGVLDGHVVLDRQIAERGRYPAIDLLRSVSRSLPEAASPAENALITSTRRLLGAHARSETMIRAGLYSEGSDPELDQAIRVWAELDGFVAETEAVSAQNSFARLGVILRRAGMARPAASRSGGRTEPADTRQGVVP